MAASPTDFLSVASMKSELRLPASINEHDSLIAAQIARAVSFVSERLGYPLVDRGERCLLAPPNDSTPFRYSAGRGRNSLVSRELAQIRYWATDGELRSEPDTTLALADLGRRFRFGRSHFVYPPAAGWPAVLAGSSFEVTVNAGVPALNIPAGIVSAIVLAVRQLYDGNHEIRPNSAIDSFLAPFIPLGPTPDVDPDIVAKIDTGGGDTPVIPVGDHNRYLLLTDDDTVPSADEFANSLYAFGSDTILVPAHATAQHYHVAEIYNDITNIHEGGTVQNFRSRWTAQASLAIRNIGGVDHFIYSTLALQLAVPQAIPVIFQR